MTSLLSEKEPWTAPASASRLNDSAAPRLCPAVTHCRCIGLSRYFLRAGQVHLLVSDESGVETTDLSEAVQLAVQRSFHSLKGLVNRKKGQDPQSPTEQRLEERTLLEMRPRAVVGSSEFFMRIPRRTTARCSGKVAVFCFTRRAMDAMSRAEPALAAVVQLAVIHCLAQTLQTQFVGKARKLHTLAASRQ